MSHPESTGQSHPTAVFAPSPRARASVGTIVLVLLSIALMLGGFYAMSAAFGDHGMGLPLFAAGLGANVLGFWLTFGIIPSRER